MVIAAASTPYINVTVTQTNDPAIDITGTPPQFAFLTGSGNPAVTDWHTGEWDPDAADDVARILVGPDGGALELDADRYRVWIKFAGGAETLVIPTGTLTVT